MKKMKSLLAFLLVLALVPVSALAAPADADYFHAQDAVDAGIYLAECYQQGQFSAYIKAPEGADAEQFVLDSYYYFRMVFADYAMFRYSVNGTNIYIEITLDGLELLRSQAELAAEAAVSSLITEQMTPYEKLLAIHNYIIEGCEYDYHSARNTLSAPKETYSAFGALIRRLAVCDGYSAAFALMCKYAGIPCVYVLSEEMNHSWNAVIYGGQVCYIDATFNDTGGPDSTLEFFLLSAEQLRDKGHSWDEGFAESILGRMWGPGYVAAYSLNSLGLFRGSDRGYELERMPYRSEAAVMLVRLMGLEEDALTMGPQLVCPYDDVNDFYRPYIAYLADRGLTRGTSDTTFSPQLHINIQQYMTFVLRALGYDDGQGDFAWEDAVSYGVLYGVISQQDAEVLLTQAFDRGVMAYISYQALFANLKDGVRLMDYLVENGSINGLIVAEMQINY